MEGLVLDVCQGFARDICQGRLTQQPTYEIVSWKFAVFLTSAPMAKLPEYFDILDQNKDAIMALLSFLAPVEIFPGIWGPTKPDDPNMYVYDFDVNPTFVLEYGTLQSGRGFSESETDEGAFAQRRSGYQGQPNPDPTDGEGHAFSVDEQKANVDAMRKALVLVWSLYSGPAGSIVTFSTQDYVSAVNGSQAIASVAPAPDFDTPTFGSVLKQTMPALEQPRYQIEAAFAYPQGFVVHVFWGSSIGFADIATGLDIDAGYGPNFPIVRGDYGGAGGSGSGGGAGSAGGGMGDDGL